MAGSTDGWRKVSRRKPKTSESSDDQRSSKRRAFGRTALNQSPKVGADNFAKYCCFLQNPAVEGTAAHGSGFIVEFEDLQNAKLLALNWKRREKTGELQTDYALITSHSTIPGSDLNGWKVYCQAFEDGNEQTLSELVSGVVSCCGPESFFDRGHPKMRTLVAHPNDARCHIHLNITILFLNRNFTKKLQGVQESRGGTVPPPVVSVLKCLRAEYKRIISSGKEQSKYNSTHFCVYFCCRVGTVPQTLVSLIEQQVTMEQITMDVSAGEHQDTSVINHEIDMFEKFLKISYRERKNSTLNGQYYGSPVVYHSPTTNEHSIIGVHVGKTDHEGEFVAVTFDGIIHLLQGELIPVLSVLRYFQDSGPIPWPSRWAYLVTPYLDQMKWMESGYFLEVLHHLLKERCGTLQLVTLTVHQVDADNEATLDLLCALFKHLNEAVTVSYDKCLSKKVEGNITQLCEDLLNLLRRAVQENEQVERGGQPYTRSLVEKCCILYDRLLHNSKFAGITEQILCTSENLDRLKHIRQKYKDSDVVQENAYNIVLKCFYLKTEKSPMFTPGSILTLTALILAVVSILGVLLFQIGPFADASLKCNCLLPTDSPTTSPHYNDNCHHISRKQDLYMELGDIGNWEALCAHLEVPEAVLTELVHEQLENTAKKQRCLAAYIDQGNACWEKVVEVVAGYPFYKKKLATQVAKKYSIEDQR